MRIVLIVVGAITATPVLAVIWPEMLQSGYGLTEPDAMTTALLRHRGVLQAALGAALCWAAFFRPARVPAAATAIVTKSAFLLLTAVDPAMRADIGVFTLIFDPLAIVVLVMVIARSRRHRPAWTAVWHGRL